jgi:hypothetical protein
MKPLSTMLLLTGLVVAFGNGALIAQPPPPPDPFPAAAPPGGPIGGQLPPAIAPMAQTFVAPPPPGPVAVAPAPHRQPADGPLRRLRKKMHNFFHPGEPV